MFHRIEMIYRFDSQGHPGGTVEVLNGKIIPSRTQLGVWLVILDGIKVDSGPFDGECSIHW